MKFNADRADLKAAATAAAKAVGKRASLPVLSGLLIIASENGVTFHGTDLELTVQAGVPGAACDEAGEAVVSAAMFLAVLNASKSEHVTIEASDGELTIIGTRGGRSTIKTMASDDYPTLPTPNAEIVADFSMGADTLGHAIGQVLPSVRKDASSFPVTQGICLMVEAPNVTLAATDSYRLAVRSFVAESSNGTAQVTVPPRAALEMSKLAGTVRVCIYPSMMTAETDGVTLTSRFIEGDYPKYEQFFPTDCPVTVSVNKNELADTITAVTPFAIDKQPVVFDLSADPVAVTAAMVDVGHGEETLDAKVSGDGFRFAVTPQYIKDGLNAISGSKVAWDLQDGLKPCVLRSDDDDSFRYLLMPVRL